MYSFLINHKCDLGAVHKPILIHNIPDNFNREKILEWYCRVYNKPISHISGDFINEVIDFGLSRSNSKDPIRELVKHPKIGDSFEFIHCRLDKWMKFTISSLYTSDEEVYVNLDPNDENSGAWAILRNYILTGENEIYFAVRNVNLVG